MLFLTPLIVLLYTSETSGTKVIVLMTMAALGYMIKPSFAMISLAFSLGALVLSRRAVVAGAVGSLLALAVIAPQSYSTWWREGTLVPYTNSNILAAQLGWSITHWRYETVMVGSDGTGRSYATEFVEPADPVAWLYDNPGPAFSLALGHTIAAFDWTNLRPYIIDDALPAYPARNILIGAMLFLGFSRMINRRGYCTRDYALDVLLVGNLAVLPFLAVETRFTLIPMIIVSILVLEHFKAGVSWQTAVRACGFGLVFSFATFMIQTTV